jgi:integrase
MARPKRKTPWLEFRNGIAYAFWYDDVARQTRRISLRTVDEGEAQSRFAQFLLHGRDIRSPRPGTLTVARALDDYLKEHVERHCADSTRQRDISRHLKTFFGDRPLEDVDVPTSRDYADARMAGQIGGGARRKERAGSASTIRRELNVLVAAANHAIWMGRAPKGWQPQVDLPPERRLGPDDEAPYYDRDELDAIFAKAEDVGGEMEPFTKLLYLTGARRRSIEDLTRDQVRMAQKRIILQPAGKRATKKRQPIVPILSSMEPIVARLLDTGGPKRLFSCADFYRPYKSLCLSVGIDDNRAHPHIMRHTRATHLLQDGKSIYDVAKLLGDTIATVERVYGHHSADHLATRLE